MLDFAVLEPFFPLLATSVWITLKFTFFSTIMGFFFRWFYPGSCHLIEKQVLCFSG